MTTLHCRCGIEVGIVRLNADTLALGHRVNPRNNRHAVRLARSGQERRSPDVLQTLVGREDTPARSEGPHPSSLMTNGTRAASKGRTRTATPPGFSSPARRASRAEGRPPASVPRPTRSAGSLQTAGEGD